MRGDDPIRETTSETELQLDRLWEATRPEAPSARDWDRVWASVSAELDRPAFGDRGAIPFSQPARRRGWAAVGLIIAAQAAAVLLALGLTLGRFDADPGPDRAEPALVTAAVRVEEGQLVLIRSDADAVQVTELSPLEGSGGVDPWYLVYNLLESLANPVVAMSE